jgi:hypothetical protein
MPATESLLSRNVPRRLPMPPPLTGLGQGGRRKKKKKKNTHPFQASSPPPPPVGHRCTDPPLQDVLLTSSDQKMLADQREATNEHGGVGKADCSRKSLDAGVPVDAGVLEDVDDSGGADELGVSGDSEESVESGYTGSGGAASGDEACPCLRPRPSPY